MNAQSEWHFIVDEAGERRQEGPVSTEALAELASSGTISGESLVWQEGMAEWLPLCEAPEFSRFFHGGAPAEAGEPESSVAPDAPAPEEPAPEEPVDTAEPPDIVTLRDFDNHSVQFSRSRDALLVVTNDYHAGPLALTKLDLLSFLTEMEKAAGKSARREG